jgi:hypothetical protein
VDIKVLVGNLTPIIGHQTIRIVGFTLSGKQIFLAIMPSRITQSCLLPFFSPDHYIMRKLIS